MNFNGYKRVRLTDIAAVERVKKGIVYKANTIFIQVSASKGQTIIIDNDMEMGTQYVSVIPKIDINAKYLKISIDNEMEQFLQKYQTGLNIQVDTFKHMYIYIHDKETQEYIVNSLMAINQEIEQEEKEIQLYKSMKYYYLRNMFV